jgi:hypothetical protein
MARQAGLTRYGGILASCEAQLISNVERPLRAGNSHMKMIYYIEI